MAPGAAAPATIFIWLLVVYNFKCFLRIPIISYIWLSVLRMILIFHTFSFYFN